MDSVLMMMRAARTRQQVYACTARVLFFSCFEPVTSRWAGAQRPPAGRSGRRTRKRACSSSAAVIPVHGMAIRMVNVCSSFCKPVHLVTTCSNSRIRLRSTFLLKRSADPCRWAKSSGNLVRCTFPLDPLAPVWFRDSRTHVSQQRWPEKSRFFLRCRFSCFSEKPVSQ
jgi:hypothetical protein